MAFARRRAGEAWLFIGALAVWLLAYLRYFHGGETFEFCHYAEIGSNLLTGRGFTTRFFYPSSLAYLHQAGIPVRETGPVFERFPLFGAWSALWLAVGGRGDFGMALGNGVAHALGAALLFGLGRRWFSERAALAAAVLWALNPVVLLGFDQMGHADVLFGVVFGVLAVLFGAALRDGSAGPKRFAALGLLGGAAFLGRYSFLLWLPVFLAAPFLFRRKGALREASAFLAAFAAVWLPWALYEKTQIGQYSPAFGTWNLAEGTLVPVLSWMEYRTFSLGDFLAPGVPTRVLMKGWSLFNLLLKDVPTLFALGGLFPFAAAGMATEAGPASGLAVWLVSLFGWQAAVMSFLRYESLGGFFSGRYYLWAGPFVVLYAAAFLERKARGSGAWRLGALAVAGVVGQLWLFAYANVPAVSDHSTRRPVGDWPELVYVRDRTPKDAWILTNLPTQVAWYAGRRSINIPNQPSDVLGLERDWPVDYLLLSKHRIGELKNYPAWQAILVGGPEARDKALAAFGFEPDSVFEEAILYKRKAG